MRMMLDKIFNTDSWFWKCLWILAFTMAVGLVVYMLSDQIFVPSAFFR
jgi:hypothetical protein